ncbi:hypothetical protein D3C78_545460 [compost metagenome]
MSKSMDTRIISFGMDTEITHRAFGKYAEEALRAVNSEAARLEQMLSCFIPGGEISRINRSAGIQCEKLSPDTFELLSWAVKEKRHPIKQRIFHPNAKQLYYDG